MSHFRLVECVPNFSEGQNREVIDAIAQAIAGTEGCSLLDVDAGVSTNRTVYTFVGSPEDVVEGALNGAKMARQLIDMTQHRGSTSFKLAALLTIRRINIQIFIYKIHLVAGWETILTYRCR